MKLTRLRKVKGWFVPAFFVLLILALSTATNLADTTSTPFGTLNLHQNVWGQTSELFPNSTAGALLANKSLIPGMHVMSLVNNVQPTWLIISSDNELSINMRYESTSGLPSPTVSLLATALKTTGEPSQVPRGTAYERATGTNITQAGWISPVSVPLLVDGTLSLYDADLIVVMIVPYTGPSLTNATNATSSIIPQDLT